MKFISTIITLTILSFICLPTLGQTSISKVDVFYGDTSFRNIAVDESGNVYALSNRKGMVKYDQNKWQNWNGFGTAFTNSSTWQIAVKGNDVWVASSGSVLYLGSGAAGNNNNFFGGVLKFNNQNSFNRTYYKGRPVLGQTINQGPPTRNILGIHFDSNGTLWCAASYHDSVTYPAVVNYNARYHFVPGAVGRFNGNNFDFITGADLPDPTGILLGVGNNYKDDSYSIGKRRTTRSITQVGNEMWVGSDGYDQSPGNLITAGILRYDLAGNYISKFDENNCAIPFGLTNNSMGPWSIYQDKIGRVWVGMNGFKGIAVRDTNNVWTNIAVPTNLPSNTVFRSNGISGNNRGEVFFATSQGLLEYKGKGSFTSDTSYRVYSETDGLSSNSIFGVASGKDGSIWVATGSGINKITRGDLIVYTLTSDVFTPSLTESDDFRRVIATYDTKSPQEEINKDTLFIAADDSRATVLKYSGSDPKNMAFRIKDDAAAYNPEKHGRFFVKYLNPGLNDSIRVQYYHPKYIEDLYTVSTQFNGKNVRLHMVDTTVSPEQIILDIPVKFVLPPVLMVHGIWSDGNTWDNMKNYLLSNGIYQYKPFEIYTPTYPSDMGFASNTAYIQYFIRDLLEKCVDNKISVGKVDVVTHSMGGILTRLYLQDKYSYKKDIHKLITINTPHSGSPMANILTNKDQAFRWSLKKLNLTGNADNGALADLRIGYPAINQLLNGDNLNKNKVPSHAIYSTDEIPDFVEFLNNQTTDFVTSPIKVKGNPLYQAAAKLTVFGLKYYLTKNTSCSWNSNLKDCLQQLFDGKSDFIVSEVSQKGGIATEAQTGFTGLWHSNVNKAQPTSFSVLDLLRENANSSDFSMDGFDPDMTLKWDSLKGTVHQRKGPSDAESVNIISPAYGATVNRGDSVHITVRASAGIKRILFVMAYENDMDSWAIETPDSIFSFKVPEDVMSRINYSIFGFNASGEEYTDSSYITISPDPALLVDSIRVDYPAKEMGNLKIPVEDSSHITVWGYFNDGIKRDITYETGLTYQTLSGSVSISGEGYAKGLVIGFDELIASYLGKSDTTYLEIIPKVIMDLLPAAALPVRFTKTTARYTGKDVSVQWTTEMEQNNNHFEIEYSTDGNHFTKAGSVAATNYKSGGSYSFDHTEYTSGNNYYRIKQVDLDGKFTYSNIVVAIVHLKNNISLYPNPVTNEFVIDLSKAANQKGKMVVLYNNLGQAIFQKSIASGQIKIHIGMANFAQGIYSIEIVDAGNKRIWKDRFVKTK